MTILANVLNLGSTYWYITPLLIFFARIIDVSIGTVKLIFISKGMKATAAILGFLEVLIWIVVVTQIIQNLDQPINYIAYAAGFATGTYIGMLIENKLAFGYVVVQVITNKTQDKLEELLKAEGYGFTSMQASGSSGPSGLTLTIVKRNQVKKIIEKIRIFDEDAMYSIEDVKLVSSNITPIAHPDKRLHMGIRRFRKGK